MARPPCISRAGSAPEEMRGPPAARPWRRRQEKTVRADAPTGNIAYVALPVLCLFMVSLGYGVVVPLLPELSGGAASVTPGVMSLVFATYAAAKIGIQV